MQPKSLQIQTIDFCNRKCLWCPNSKYQKEKAALMKDDVFRKILADLKHIRYQGEIHLYLMGEALCDPDIVERVRQTRREFEKNIIFISTNGDYLDREKAKELIDAGITWVGVSHYDNENKQLFEINREFPQTKITPLGQLRQYFYNRAGHVDIEAIRKYKQCDWVFEKAYINRFGDLVLCCSDYDFEVNFGNVMESSFYEIYNSERYNEYREHHYFDKGKKMDLCGKCNRIV